MFPELHLIDFLNRERALEAVIERRRVQRTHSPHIADASRRPGRLARVLHRR